MDHRWLYRLNIFALLCLYIHLFSADRFAVRFVKRVPPTDAISERSSFTIINPPPATLAPGSSSENSMILYKPSPAITDSNPSSINLLESQSPTAVNSAMNGMSTSTSGLIGKIYEVNPNNLPITPQISPGFAVSGVILILSGTAYALIGIRNRWLHTYLSTAYLASLAVTALIFYVMKPSVSQGIQAAYFIAVVISGMIWGAVSIVFMEITEGLGCLLGGFCLSMWLMTLRSGGLLSGFGKLILITIFSLGGLAIFYIQYIKLHAHMVFISFAGATSFMLGIDCFSRAGLKEFWLFVWDLNSDVFPPGTLTYPLTRGIKVEIASILFITLMGVISQMRLWKLVQERKKYERDEISKETQVIENEEESIARQIKKDIDDERKQWEAQYGCHDDVLSLKDRIETEDKNHPENSNAAENIENINEHVPESMVVQRTRLSNCSARSSKESQINRATLVSSIGLVPPLGPDATETTDGVRSSVCTCGTLGDETPNDVKGQTVNFSSRPSLLHNSSGVSIGSEKSRNSIVAQQSIGDAVSSSHSAEERNQNSEPLTPSPNHAPISDGESQQPTSPISPASSLSASSQQKHESLKVVCNLKDEKKTQNRPLSIEDSHALQNSTTIISVTETNLNSEQPLSKSPGKCKINSPKSIDYKPSLRDINGKFMSDNISKVLTSFRTNEWAKHLSYAETPEVDELRLSDSLDESEIEINEKPAPVNIRELQQTPETCSSQASLHISKQQDNSHYVSRRNSNLNHRSSSIEVTHEDKTVIYSFPGNGHTERVSRLSLASQSNRPSVPIECYTGATINDPRLIMMDRSRGKGTLPVLHQNSKQANRATLIGQRDSMIRTKTQLRKTSSSLTHDINISPVSRETCEMANSKAHLIAIPSEENMSLSQRRSLIHQSSPTRRSLYPVTSSNISPTSTLNTHQSRYRNIISDPNIHEQKMASWRASVQENLLANTIPFDIIEQKQSMLHETKEQERLRRLTIERQTAINGAMDGMMRSEEMLDAHREALRRMQQKANQNFS